jgi:thiol:disulfide interchange protein
MNLLRTGLSCFVAMSLLALTNPCVAAAPKLSGYDSKADPQVDLSRALVEAKASNRKVLVIAGGDWCIWCHYLQAFLEGNKDVDAALHRSFVTVKAYIGDENQNIVFFSRLPKASGYPHFWVISSDGQTKRSVNTAPLENGGKSYDKARFLKFIRDMER